MALPEPDHAKIAVARWVALAPVSSLLAFVNETFRLNSACDRTPQACARADPGRCRISPDDRIREAGQIARPTPVSCALRSKRGGMGGLARLAVPVVGQCLSSGFRRSNGVS